MLNARVVAGLIAVVAMVGGAARGDARQGGGMEKARLPMLWEDAPGLFCMSARDASARFTDRGVELALQRGDQGWMLRWGLAAGSASIPRGEHARAGTMNVIDESGTRSGMRTYERVVYSNAAPGAELSIDLKPGALKYTLTLDAGADLSCLAFRYEGATEVRVLDGGTLEIVAGSGAMRESGLVCWQPLADGSHKPVAAHYESLSPDSYRIVVEPVDPRLPLVVDPTIQWSTYIGGTQGVTESGTAIAADAFGNVIMAGKSGSPTYPITPGAFSSTAYNNAVITKFSAAGALIWSTAIGGTGAETIEGIRCDSSGRVAIAGWTSSINFPLMNPFQATKVGQTDGFVSLLSTDGSSLVWSSYIGGALRDDILGMTMDSIGAVYVTGRTYSTNFPIVGGFDSQFSGGSIPYVGYMRDGFVAKIAADGSGIVWSSYIGGDFDDVAYAVAVDAQGNAYVTGMTDYNGWLTNPFSTGGGMSDVFIAKIDASGSQLVWASRLGGSGSETGHAVAVDAQGSVYVAGTTDSADFPIVGGVDSTLGGYMDCFVAKIDSTGAALTWSSYVGGNGDEECAGLEVDPQGNAYIAGTTYWSDDLTMVNPADATYVGDSEGYVVRIAANGASLAWSTYLGGSVEDFLQGMTLDGQGRVYVTGYTYSDDFPLVAPYDSTFDGAYYSNMGWFGDAFVVGFDGVEITAPPPVIVPRTNSNYRAPTPFPLCGGSASGSLGMPALCAVLALVGAAVLIKR